MTRWDLGAKVDAAHEKVARLCDQGLEPHELVHEVAQRVRRVVPYDRASWGLTDPDAMLETHGVVAEPFKDCFLDLEVAQLESTRDVNRFDDLDRSGRCAVTLESATGGDLAASARHRTALAPRGFGDELRLLARSGGATWGTATLLRATDIAPFSPDETRFVASLAAELGRGLRVGLTRPPLAAPAAGGAGTVVVGADGQLEGATDHARRWLARMPSPYAGDHLPPAIELVAIQARAVAGGAAANRPARMRIRIPGQGWLLVRADVLGGPDGTPPRVAVMIEPASRAELLPLLLAIHGLTRREREVTALLIEGLGTNVIAERLGVSRHTLRDHVKAVFAKLGVRSRPELTALLAADVRAG